MKIYIFPIVILSLLVPTASTAQEYSGCFMIDATGTLSNLNNLCSPDKVPSEPVIVDGVQLTGTGLLFDGGRIPVIIGKLKNVSDKTIKISSVTFQLEDTKTKDVVTPLVLDINTELAPGQAREFRQSLSSTIDLGGRTAKGLDIVFFGWD